MKPCIVLGVAPCSLRISSISFSLVLGREHTEALVRSAHLVFDELLLSRPDESQIACSTRKQLLLEHTDAVVESVRYGKFAI